MWVSIFDIAEDILLHCLDSWSVNGRTWYKCVCVYIKRETGFPVTRVYGVLYFTFIYSKLDSGQRIEEGNLSNQLNWKTNHSQQSWEKLEVKGTFSCLSYH